MTASERMARIGRAESKLGLNRPVTPRDVAVIEQKRPLEPRKRYPVVHEADIQKLIVDWLAIKHVFCYRQNAGAMSGSHKGKRWFVRFARPGASDLVAVVKGRYIGIEVKTAAGEQSRAQREFETELTHAGGIYVLARSLEDVVHVIEPMLWDV